MSKSTVVHCPTPHAVAEAMKRVEIIQPWPSDGVDVFVKPHKERRTNPQNSRMWWLHNLEAAHLNLTWPERAAAIVVMLEQAGTTLGALERRALLGKVWNKDDVHEEFKKRYLAGHSSTKPSRQDFTVYLDEYEAELRTAGVHIPDDIPEVA